MKKILILSLVLSVVTFAKVIEGAGEGLKGPIKLAVTLDGENISKIEVLETSDTKGIFNRAFSTLQPALIGKNSTEGLDIVAGSSYSSKGILDAVNDALSKK